MRCGWVRTRFLHLDRLPLSAIVNDAVAIVKASRMRSASGFVNAILRRLAREREHIAWPERPGHVESDDDRQAMIEHLSVVHSHPAWLVARWIDRYGIAVTEAWLTFNNRPPATTLAANRLRGNRDALAARLLADGVGSVPTTTAPHGLTVVARRVLSSEAFRDGACVIQDEASQIISELAGGIDGGRILDACASPGGKTLALAAISGAAGLVVAADVRAAPRRSAGRDHATLPAALGAHCPRPGCRSAAISGCDLRLRAGRCSLLGSWHRASRPGHTMAASGVRLARACRCAARAARTHRTSRGPGGPADLQHMFE